MSRIANLDEAEKVLAQFKPTSAAAAYTLKRMYVLMDFLGNPQNKLKVVHVAGTSGKTSTCYYSAALLKATGQKVGLSVSPHVMSVTERLQINLEPMGEAEFCRALSEFLDLIEKSQIEPTYFELLVALAYWQFEKLAVDYAVIEVGLGGLLDGTNVVNRSDKVCVITDIGLDHINVLGTTLPEIAAQKAGIIQPKNVVFTHRQADEILDVFKKRADQQGAMLKIIEPQKLSDGFDFLPLFQQHNFSLAREVVNYVLSRDHDLHLSLNQELEAAKFQVPARMEIFKHGDKTVILDGAHNAQKLAALTESIKAKFPGQEIAALVSFADGRGYRLDGSLSELIKLTDNITFTGFKKDQDLIAGPVDPERLAELVRVKSSAKIEVVNDAEEAFQKLLAQEEKVLLVTGSFFLMNQVRPLAQKL